MIDNQKGLHDDSRTINATFKLGSSAEMQFNEIYSQIEELNQVQTQTNSDLNSLSDLTTKLLNHNENSDKTILVKYLQIDCSTVTVHCTVLIVLDQGLSQLVFAATIREIDNLRHARDSS